MLRLIQVGKHQLVLAFAVSLVAGTVVLAEGKGSAQTCQCQDKGSPMYELAFSDAVFRGTVIGVEPDPNGSQDLRVAFTVGRVWKGPNKPAFDVFTPANVECGNNFEIGGDYLVYASNRSADGTRPPGCLPEDIRLFTSRCSRTKAYDPAEAAELECPAPVSVLTQSQVEEIALKTFGLERNPEVPARVVSVELKAACQLWKEQSCSSWFRIDDHAPLWTVTMYGEGICTPRCPPPIPGGTPCNPPPRNGFSVTIDGRDGYVVGGGCIQLRMGDVHWLFVPSASKRSNSN